MLRLNRNAKQILLIAVSLLACSQVVHASEADALKFSTRIQEAHMPYLTVLDPVFASSDPNSPEYWTLVSYTRAGDSALWTGHYLAAEALRYFVTRSPDALANAWRALWGIRVLIDITGNHVLARCLIPTNSPYASSIQQEEGGHGIYYNTLGGQTYFWIGNTSRDQYSGVMFGLSLAYDLIDDAAVRDFIRNDVTRLLNNLLNNNWNVVMPGGGISTTFLHRSDQQLSFLQVGRRINPQRFDLYYQVYRFFNSGFVGLPIAVDNADPHNHYFKFNLNYINLLNLIRMEDNPSYRQLYMDAYNSLRSTTAQHGNAHFNMIDLVLNGQNFFRDTETVSLLSSWLQRPQRDYWVDLRGIYPACGVEQACNPIPVVDRVNTDFLWQRSPFLLYGGGFGTIETASIDYLLTYWMARLFGLPVG